MAPSLGSIRNAEKVEMAQDRHENARMFLRRSDRPIAILFDLSKT
jgi:hypothetical protein